MINRGNIIKIERFERHCKLSERLREEFPPKLMSNHTTPIWDSVLNREQISLCIGNL
jgi:hypothetical protein